MAFLPVNFDRQILREELQAAGFQCDRPAFFSWLGVTALPDAPSIHSDDAVHSLDAAKQWRRVRLCGRAILIELSGGGRAGRLTLRVGAVRLFFEPRELAKELAEIGFRRLEDLSREEINARYFAGRGDELQVTNGIGRLMSAWGKGLE
jgi:O-methyltransferase involved in polyketide biosynthesis